MDEVWEARMDEVKERMGMNKKKRAAKKAARRNAVL